MEVKNSINNLDFDQFGRPSGILIVDKPAGMSSHDIVNEVRYALKIRKVGHAGALDTFSTGVMLILVGKATKLSDSFMGMEKSYTAKMLLGVATETQDIEGKVVKCKPDLEIDEKLIKLTINSFDGGYSQGVSPFSSVKVAGKKLRKVLRDKTYTYKIVKDNKNERFIELYGKDNNVLKERILIPKRDVKIKDIEIKSIETVESADLHFAEPIIKGEYIVVTFSLSCSKGTYVRQLAEDIGEKLGAPACLIALRRTRIGEFTEELAFKTDQISSISNQ